MKIRIWIATILLTLSCASSFALDSVPKPEYHQRRAALAEKLHGGIAVLFAAEESVLDFMPYRQDSDFYYLSGWNEPGAAIVILPAVDAAPETPGTALGGRAAQPYREILFLPTRNPRTEKYTGPKMDAATPGVAATTGFDEVLPMTELPAVLNKIAQADRNRIRDVWTEKDSPQAKALLGFTAATLGLSDLESAGDVSQPIMTLRAFKSPAEVELIRKATDASIAAQLAGMRTIMPGVRERTVAGVEIAKMMQEGCERPSYAPIVGSGPNSTTLHYSDNSRIMKSGDTVVIDEAGEYSMYASDITRTMPVSGHFTARQREIYNLVLGAQRAAAAAFVAGKSTINDPQHKRPDSLDTIAFNYINEHGKDLHGQPLGQYMVHGIGHLVGIDVHDPWEYSRPLDKGMVFTIEPGLYLPEENIGVRIEDVFYVGPDGKLIDLVEKLPHEATDIEAAMKK
ncbi:aminopeptidase P N-terminal domain-containing protein [Edaphobacter albus]|uniref:aminopeptidase P N-terminal domain-containing protein n=1 Tax=Edaphobacter sp. 4G125 TaxID=2763071 RepID=UPI001646B34A|nr:aminopeptidase P N-terminal domain-containing protein [Edaphobacter sp. 4G125]QNI36496.1 aminopeptidase P N-terminal domain-containing protein [Edaphobacter sp. 4G125]